MHLIRRRPRCDRRTSRGFAHRVTTLTENPVANPLPGSPSGRSHRPRSHPGVHMETHPRPGADRSRCWRGRGVDARLRVPTDVAPSAWVVARRSAHRLGDAGVGLPLSQLVNPLVVDERGSLVPFAHGIDERFALETIDAVGAAIERARLSGLPALGRLVERLSATRRSPPSRTSTGSAASPAAATVVTRTTRANSVPIRLRPRLRSPSSTSPRV